MFIAKILQKMAPHGLTSGEHFVKIPNRKTKAISFELFILWIFQQNVHEKSGLGNQWPDKWLVAISLLQQIQKNLKVDVIPC